MSAYLIVINACYLIAAPAEVTEPEREVLKSRRRITRGEVVIHAVKREGDLSANNGVTTTEVRETIIFDGGNIRSDRQHTVPRMEFRSEGTTKRNVLETLKRVKTQDRLIRYSNVVSPNGRGTGVTIDGLQPGGGAKTTSVFDPRVIGLVPSCHSALYAMHLEIFVGRADRKESTVTNEVLDGEQVLKVQYVRHDGNIARMWIAPAKGHCVVRAEIEGDYQAKTFVQAIQCRLKRYPDGNVWFPQSVVSRETLDGKLMSEETLTVERARFNHAVDQQAFTLAGMDVPAGASVLERPPHPKGTRFWDGSKLSFLKAKAPAGTPPGEQAGSRWLFIVSLGLALLAALCLILYFRSRSKSAVV